MSRRSPIIVFVGHVDHGKSSLLDKIRESVVQKKEPGGITQCIGATEIPSPKINQICGELLKKLDIQLNIPGVLAIDTPGHEAFTNLRKRGGSIADLAVLVIDITQGIQTQTRESIEILKHFKVPFIIAANKIDLIPGWRAKKTLCFHESIKEQSSNIKEYLQNKMYDIMVGLGNYNIDCDIYNKIKDYKEKVAIIPCSAKTGEGVSELLMLISGLSQKYLGEELKTTTGKAKGNILEVKKTKGMGTTIDIIIYDGIMKKNQYLVVGSIPEPIITRIRALLKPFPLQEIRDKQCKFKQIKKVAAATGIKINAPNLENAVPGMPVRSADSMSEAKKLAEEMKEEMSETIIETEKEGIVLKADSLGSLEAITAFMKNHGIKISKAKIGNINKKNVMNAVRSKEQNQYLGVIMGFNVNIHEDAEKLGKSEGIKFINSKIIYELLEEYKKWKNTEMEKKKKEELKKIMQPCKIRVLGDFVFRKSNPAVVGVEVIMGKITSGTILMNSAGDIIGRVKKLEEQGVTKKSAIAGERLACSIKNAVYEKDFTGGEILYSSLPEKEFLKIKKKLRNYMTENELSVVQEVMKIKRKKNFAWGMG